MPTRTGKCILARDINIDKDYTNVLSYSESNMLSLIQSNAVATMSDCSFIRPDGNEIDVNTSYGTAIQANYIAFENPDYNNKWFFAFIEEVKYVSNGTTRIIFQIDDFSTWWSFWSPKSCFVIREHIANDTIGNNLVPENVETGEYVNNGSPTFCGFGGGKFYCTTTSYLPDGTSVLGTNCGGIPMAGAIMGSKYWQQTAYGIQEIANNGQMDGIQQVFIIPFELADLGNTYWNQHGSDSEDDHTWWDFKGRTTPITKTTNFARPSQLNGYTPRNKKLLTGQFMFAMLDNFAGTVNKLEYEYFNDPSNIVIEARGVISVGCSITVYPKNYKGDTYNVMEGVMQGKFPTLSWSGDSFTNWLTQNSVNISTGLISAGASLALAPTAPQSAISGGLSIMSTIGQIYQHSICPQSVRGNTNGGDTLTANNLNNVVIHSMSIRSEFAQRIDQYFDKYGYATNKLKSPNITGRTYWNFIQISNDDCIGYSNNQSVSVPPKAMENINNIFRKGVTVWHNHANIGNYSLNNTIV